MLLRIPACSQDGPVSNPHPLSLRFASGPLSFPFTHQSHPPFPNPFVCVNKWKANKRDNSVHILSYFSCALVNVRQVWMGQKPIKKIFTECHASSLEVWLHREVLTHWVLQKKKKKTAHIQTASVNSEAGKIDPSNRKEQVKKMSLGSDLGADANISFWKYLFISLFFSFLFFSGKEFVELGYETAWEIHLPLLDMTFNYLKRFHMGPLHSNILNVMGHRRMFTARIFHQQSHQGQGFTSTVKNSLKGFNYEK